MGPTLSAVPGLTGPMALSGLLGKFRQVPAPVQPGSRSVIEAAGSL